jgi:hypothetical protein
MAQQDAADAGQIAVKVDIGRLDFTGGFDCD